MSQDVDWKQRWEEQAAQPLSDHELDRGVSMRAAQLEQRSTDELLRFIGASASETVLDAGCGTGVNIQRLHASVHRVIGVDFSFGSVARTRRRIQDQRIGNASAVVGSVAALPIASGSVDRILCMSVLQYLDDGHAKAALHEFARILRCNGSVVLHVKNASSLYFATLWWIKRLKARLGMTTKFEYVRPYQWYVRQLASAGFELTEFNSLNLFVVDGLPAFLVDALQRLEFWLHRRTIWHTKFVQRHGPELKLKARCGKVAATIL